MNDGRSLLGRLLYKRVYPVGFSTLSSDDTNLPVCSKVDIRVVELSYDATFEEVDLSAQDSRVIEDMQVVESSDVLVNTIRAKKVIFTWADGTARYCQIYAVKDQKTYMFTYCAPPEYFDRDWPAAERILRSWRF